MPAIDRQHRSAHERTRIAGQKQKRAIQITQVAQAAHRNAVANVCLALVAIEVGVVHFGLEVTRRDGIDADLITRQLQGQ
ncbi:hypothetical protein D3C86_1903450 [compost metagenome]